MEAMDLVISWGIRLVTAVLILVAGWMIGNWVSKWIKHFETLDTTLAGFLGGFAKYAVFAVAIVTVLAQFGVQTASLIAVLGAAGLAIGLALQGTLSNVAAGMMLLVLRPFNVGDFISFGGTSGTVKALGLFGTELATTDNIYIFAPNSQIWGSDIQNFSRNGERRQDIVVGISYDDDINKAIKVIQKVLDKDSRLLSGEGQDPQIMVTNMGDFAIDLTVRFWTRREDFWTTQIEMKKALKEAMDKGGITIPFPTRTVKVEGGDAATAAKAVA
ncbi:MAG: mechanosensitive ion channel [Alphaproteobacteria bacterium]|nr:mechanosensitive ion channel [Alphaproteobacteria bacterium]